MKLAILLLTFISFIFANDPYKNIEYKKLKNGLQVYMLSNKKAAQTTIRLSVKDGNLIEDNNNTGIAHLTEHMIFRDSKLQYKDYLDLFKKEGAKTNGFTSAKRVEYYVTLDANKSYWALENFYKMIFKKDWNQEDLRVEKQAVFNEIGEPHWWDRLAIIGKILKKIAPPDKNEFEELFDINRSKKELPPFYLQKINTKKFTLEDVKKHYKEYYYPKNMVLKVAGNFDNKKMWDLINSTFGQVRKDGNKSVKDDNITAKLKGKEYKLIEPGVFANRAEIGGRFIEDSYKKSLINQIYIENLANRLQRTLRNKEGKSYSIYGDTSSYKKGVISAVYIDGLHKDFKNNVKTAQEFIKADITKLKPQIYKEAMSEYNKSYFSAIEPDTYSLLDLINQIQYLKEKTNTPNETPNSLFNQITPKEFQETIKETFKKENRYSKIYPDYLLFPYDALVVIFASIIGLILMFKYMFKLKLKRLGINFSKDDITLQRRVTSRFVSFFVFIFVIGLAMLIQEWIYYFLFEKIDAIKYKAISLPIWLQYLLVPIDTMVFLLIFIYLFALILKNYRTTLYLTKDRLFLQGSKLETYTKDEIKSISVEKYSPKLFNKIRGVALRFWKPLVKITLKNGNIFYIRSNNANKLKENLEEWLNNDKS